MVQSKGKCKCIVEADEHELPAVGGLAKADSSLLDSSLLDSSGLDDSELNAAENYVAPTPSKVRRLSGEPLESPRDRRSVREIRNKTPIRKNIKFELTKAVTDFETGGTIVEDANVNKIFTSQDSYSVSRIGNTEIGQFFFCRVCGQFPREAKFSKSCSHIYCKVCIENYRTKVNTSKCPPAHSANEEDDDDEVCNIPSSIDDIIIFPSFIRNIHESILITCQNTNCDVAFTISDLVNHEA